ncbi:hypothetical protein QOZ80_1BG0072680 [Eleusine coracana subsp. coracana]|nr:hypothetical protein QOZ80_1BG0072680 [Eleusine coracana subsp. coracana]
MSRKRTSILIPASYAAAAAVSSSLEVDIPEQLQEFSKSSLSLADMNKMMLDGVLPEEARIDWKVPRESCPIPIHQQIIVFCSFFEHGFGVPCCSFLCGLHFFFGIELVNLNPNSILHIAIFVYLCEAFLGVLPHFDLFRHLFVLRPLPTTENQVAIGGIGVQLRKKEVYINIPLKTENKNWKDEWFYCDNPPPVLADFTGAKAIPQAHWTERPDPTNPQVVALLKKIADLKAEGVDGIIVAKSFIIRRVQPQKLQCHPAWDYVNEDETREVPDPPNGELRRRRLVKMFEGEILQDHSLVSKAYNKGTLRA